MIGAHDQQKMPALTTSVAGAGICLSLLFLLTAERLGFGLEGKTLWRSVLHFILPCILSIFTYRTLAHGSRPARFEQKARLAFLLTVTLGISLSLIRAFALVQHLDPLALMLNIAGPLAGMIAITWKTTGLIELNSPPSEYIRNEVIGKHEILLGTPPHGSLTKRIFDVSLSLTGLILSFPLCFLLSLAIWLEDPGPFIFAKVCVTKGGKAFKQLKFRSMIKEAEKKTGPVLATEADPRMTYIGKFMRKTAMDELPQLLNILKGNMSFVGPRPQRMVLVHKYLEEMPEYGLRHALRPGLTGVAQVHSHYYITPRQKLRYDLIYIRKRSFWLDLKLIFLSFWITFRGKWESREQKI
jgi:lipopolysaccharide/colanic/teichoic acid biosynthesis glycosyltransferase